VDTSTLLRHQAAIDEIERYLNDVETFAVLRNDNAQLRALLEAIVKETEPGCINTDPRGRYVKSCGGYRRLPDDLTSAINVASEYLGMMA